MDGIGNDGAMTVLRYFVFSTFDSVNRNIYHSSTYAGMTDKEYEEAVKSQLAKAKQRLKLKFNKYNKQKLTESSNHEHFNSTSVNSSSNSDNLKDFQIDDSVS